MGQADISAWRRQNSDIVPVLVTLIDGSRIRGTVMLPRDKSLRDLFNMPEPFFDFECLENGPMVIAKTSIASLRQHVLPANDQLEKKMRTLDKSDPHKILGIGRTATREEIRTAYVALARAYHPDRFASSELPPEIAEYIDAMARRINAAYSELSPNVKTQD